MKKTYVAQVKVLRVKARAVETNHQVMDAIFLNDCRAEEAVRAMLHAGFEVTIGYEYCPMEGTSLLDIERKLEDGPRIRMPEEYHKALEEEYRKEIREKGAVSPAEMVFGGVDLAREDVGFPPLHPTIDHVREVIAHLKQGVVPDEDDSSV